jgi:hypothetical protein
MKKILSITLCLLVLFSITLSGCKSNKLSEENNTSSPTNSINATQSPEDGKSTAQPSPTAAGTTSNIDYATVKPNEAGKIMVVMFHNFVESFTATKYDNGEYTTTFDAFRNLLQELYDKGYRLISLSDYINNNISIPAGCIPMVFTFDDGTPGQFNLVKEGDQLVANKQSAVGIIMDFNKTHPDFGNKGTFFVNLGLETFKGEGTLEERLRYLIDNGFEIGNHTYTHVNLKEIKSAEKIQEEIGQNQKKMYELVPDYKMTAFALPYGLPSNTLKDYVVKGEYQGVKYENLAVMEVGWDPWYSPVSKSFTAINTHRVRASGINPVDADLAWWLKNLSRNEQYVSDGNPDVVSVPKDKEEAVDKNKLGNKQLIVY